MKPLLREFLTCLLLIIFTIPTFAQNDREFIREKNDKKSEKRVALVIGNAAYQNASTLANPVNDATDMTATLKDLGFEVISGTNQTKAQMQSLIRQFGTRLADTKAVGLFFYAGHGIAQNGTNYLIPVDADIQAEDEIEEASVSINFLLGKMAAANNGFNMVILDACRNNPFARKWRNYRDTGDKGGLTRIDAPTGTLIAYATKPGDVASDGNGRNGLYTGALLKQMRVKNVDITKMFQYVRADVIKKSGGKQVPFDESSLVGDFYFGGYDSTATIQNSTKTNTAEETFWRTIENSEDVRDYENYIARSKRGEFSGIYKATAELKINRLKKANIKMLWNKLRPVANKLLKYNLVDSFSEGLARVKLNEKWGVIDKNGNEVIPLKYDFVSSFSEGLATVGLGSKYGLIDKNGDEVIQLGKYDDVSSFSEGLAEVKLKGKYGLIDKSGKEIVTPTYDFISRFSDGLAVVRIGDIFDPNKKEGFIDKTGKEILPLKYESVSWFSEGLARVELNRKYGFIDKTGKEVIPLKYDVANFFSEGLAVVWLRFNGGGKSGFIDKNGNEVSPLKYDWGGTSSNYFSEGLVAMHLNGKCGYLDKSLKEVIRFKYDGCSEMSGGLARVTLNGKKGLIDTSGNEVLSPMYDEIEKFSEGGAFVKLNDKYGLINTNYQEVIPTKFEWADFWCKAFQKDGFIGVKLNGKKWFVDIYGNEYSDF